MPMNSQIYQTKEALSGGIYSGWIAWNLFLAFIPLVLSFWLFRRRTNARSWLWWVVFLVYAAFLPNAPYLLTDIIHLIRGIREGYSAWIITLVFIPLHLFAIVAGMEAYVVSLINQGNYLKRQAAEKFVVWSELITHAFCAVGIYLGRFLRFNSWDLITDPDNILITTINELTGKGPLLVIFITFLVLTVVYWIMKQITLGLVMRIRYMKLKRKLKEQ
ncbi:DUF1361 domain-containing protein [[Phormidium] sp. LEGE 05292]|uniref:DUF1361 domain-containing protein n=1 Tax=[Phormidium] sp. LEGE 05292 TaxID=767427 RepID=UPI002AD45A88|nr:DUF1361 domain-containing protein [Phormidium sp. LEGE 05292]